MREARALDWRRRICEAKGWKIFLRRIALDSVSTLGTAETKVDRPFSLLCGPNGVGKSSLLQAVWAACDPVSWRQSRFRDARLEHGAVTVDFSIDDSQKQLSVRFEDIDTAANSEDMPEVTFVNAWAEATDYQIFYQDYGDPSGLIEAVGEVSLESSEVNSLNFLVGKEYQSVTLYEIEEYVETAPFFQVQYGGAHYDSRSMGTGEICLFHIWWALRRAKQGEIILIEEPEAFLSYGSQVSLSKIIAQTAVEKKLCVLASTHSAAFLEYFGLDQAILVNRSSHGFNFINGRPRPRLLGQIGINSSIGTVAFVEDRLAKALLIALLERADPVSRKGVHVEIRGGEGEITSALKALKEVDLPFRFVGVYDGDQRDAIDG